MKKIIATVLAMVMALALCTTAFAKVQTYDLYNATTGKEYNINDDTATPGKDLKITYHKADADKKTVAYYTIENIDALYVECESNADNVTFIVKYHGSNKPVMHLAEVADVAYEGEGTAYTNIGDKCGQFSLGTTYNKDSKFYTYVDSKKVTQLAVASKVPAFYLLVKDQLVGVQLIGALDEQLNEHVWKIANDGKTAKCTVCGIEGTVYTKVSAIPADKAYDVVGNVYVAYTAPKAGTTGTTGSNGSPKTFDAGIAMYAGMALMSVAGSAVVIGKKKEF